MGKTCKTCLFYYQGDAYTEYKNNDMYGYVGHDIYSISYTAREHIRREYDMYVTERLPKENFRIK